MAKWLASNPYIFFSVFDPNPFVPTSKKAFTLIKMYPDIDNLRLLIKHKIRRIINKALPLDKRGKHFHATDNSYEARQYIDALDPRLLNTILQKLKDNYKITF